jgi:DNA-binding beta-propeller fold protein YncE
MLYDAGKYTYELVDGWAKCPEGFSFRDIGGLCIDSQDRVYVFNRGVHPVMIFDREGNLLTSWGEGLFKLAHGICLGPDGSVYCGDLNSHTVSKFTPEGKLLLVLGNKDQPSETGYMKQPDSYEAVTSIRQSGPPFNRPSDIAVSSSGEIYVSDGYGNARIHKFSPDGTLLLSWGEPGTAPGQFRLVHSLFLDKRERLWVADRMNDRIQIFNTKGEFLSQWTSLSYPCDIFIDDEETVYVAEIGRQVSIFTNDGKRLVRFGMGRKVIYQGEDKATALFYAPHSIAVDSRGDIYVGEVPIAEFGDVDRGPRTVQKFARRT